MKTFKVMLKNGTEISVKAEDCAITKACNGTIHSIEFKGVSNDSYIPWFIKTDEVMAVLYKNEN